MGHNLEIRDGQASFFSVKEKAWHGLGQIIEDCPTLEKAIELGRLNWDVEKQPMYLQNGSMIPNKFATVRKDTGDILGVVGNDYTIVQNKEAFDFFDFLKDEACFETGGVLNTGNIVWLSAKLPSHFSVNGINDQIEQYIFLITSHDGTKQLQAMFTPVRVVCNNTLNQALGNNSNKIKIRHSKSAQDKIKDAHNLMGIINNLSQELEDTFNRMHKVKITDKQLINMIASSVTGKSGGSFDIDEMPTRTRNTILDIKDYYNMHPTQIEIKGSLYGFYNAITGFNQNNDKSDDDRKMRALLNGNSIEERAISICYSMM